MTRSRSSLGPSDAKMDAALIRNLQRLCGERGKEITAAAARIAELEAEVARLREAMARIAADAQQADVREAAALTAEAWIGTSGLVDAWAAQCHDLACKMIAQDIRALPAPEVTPETIGVRAALAAAISLLERSPKTAAPSDTMFDLMLADYRRALDMPSPPSPVSTR